ncbi:MAG: hypothetical protein JXB14_02930 [Candidatus Altiarchaeota archaeon]|nr:hypothetical protein [Candidatus Altiarchaeota archaeon]
MSLIIAYLPYILLLVLSPLIGSVSLKFVYPDVKTYLARTRWLMFVIFGLVAYIPAAFLGLFEIPVPLYSASPMLFESEGNAIYFLLVFGVFLAVNSSIVEYTRAHKKVVVGVPRKVIKYSIQQEKKKKLEAQQRMHEKTKKQIEGIADKLEYEVLRSEEKGRIERLTRMVKEASELKEGKKTPREVEKAKAKMQAGLEERIGERTVKEILKKRGKPKEEVRGLEVAIAEKPKTVEEKPTPAETEGDLKAIRKDLEKVATKGESDSRSLEKVLGQLKETIKSEKLATQLERERTLSMLEEELKRRKDVREKLGPEALGVEEIKIGYMLEKLKDKLQEQGRLEEGIGKAQQEEFYTSEDIEDITNALKDLRKQEIEVKKTGRKHERGGEKAGRSEGAEEEDITESIDTYQKAYPKRREEDVLKSVVGDVRQQLLPSTKKGEEEALDESKKWYEEEGGEAKKEFGKLPDEEGVEMLEPEMSFGEEDLGLGDSDEELLEDLGGMGDLEGLGESLDNQSYDGMFVDLGEINNACPRCKKKGTTIVYCSSCGKPFCSNCATSMRPEKDSINYKCPNCGSEFAMKRRIPA